MAALIAAQNECQQHGVCLRVVAEPALTQRLTLRGLRSFLTIRPTVSDALRMGDNDQPVPGHL